MESFEISSQVRQTTQPTKQEELLENYKKRSFSYTEMESPVEYVKVGTVPKTPFQHHYTATTLKAATSPSTSG